MSPGLLSERRQNMKMTDQREITRGMAWLALAWVAVAPSASAQEAPWLSNIPIVTVEKQLYVQHTQVHVSVDVAQYVAGSGIERLEIWGNEAVSAQSTSGLIRFSSDNGRTWSSFQPVPDTIVIYASVQVAESMAYAPFYDARAGVLIQPWIRQVLGSGGKFYNASYYPLSTNHGVSWSAPRQLNYEAGPDFDTPNPLNPAFLTNNSAYIAVNVTLTASGKLVVGAGGAKDPAGANNVGGELFGALNFIGVWNGRTGAAADYSWTAGPRITIASTRSSRGLQETGTAQHNECDCSHQPVSPVLPSQESVGQCQA